MQMNQELTGRQDQIGQMSSLTVQGLGYKWATGSNINPGELTISFNQSDKGIWPIRRIEITDIYGNIVRRGDIGSLGLPSHIK